MRSRLLSFDHLNFLGRYSFALPHYLRDGHQLRPLRKPGLTVSTPALFCRR